MHLPQRAARKCWNPHYFVCMVLFLFYNVIYVFLLLWLCILLVCLCMTTLTEGFPCFLLSCKANATVKSARWGTARTFPNFCVVLCIFVLFYVLFVLWRSLYCLRVHVYWTTATGWLPNCS